MLSSVVRWVRSCWRFFSLSDFSSSACWRSILSGEGENVRMLSKQNTNCYSHQISRHEPCRLIPQDDSKKAPSSLKTPVISNGFAASEKERNMPETTLFILLFLLLTLTTHSQTYFEKGSPSVINFTPKDYDGHGQNWAITQDTFGTMYFANHVQILEYDGETWRKIKPANNVRSLLKHKNTIYWGGYNDFGKLKMDRDGKTSYESLKEQFEVENFGVIYHIIVWEDMVVFQADKYLFLLGEQKKEFLHFPNKDITNIYNIKSHFYIYNQREGLYEMDKNQRISKVSIYPMDPRKYILGIQELDSSTFFLSEQEFLFEKRNEYILKYKSKKLNPLSFDDNLNFDNFLIYEDQFFIGTRNAGLITFDKNLNLTDYINISNGLQDNWIQDQFVDRNKDLWLALNSGIAKLNLRSSLTHYSKDHNLKDAIEKIDRCYNRLYVATQSGVFKMNLKSDRQVKDVSLLSPSFKKIEGKVFNTQCWDLLPFQDQNNKELLLAISNSGIHEIYPNDKAEFILNCDAYTLVQSKQDPKRVYIGLGDGIMSLYRDGKKWIDEGKIKGIEERVAVIVERGNELWLGNDPKGMAYHVTFNEQDTLIESYSPEHGLPKGRITPFLLKDSLIFGTDRGFYRLNPITRQFHLDTFINSYFNDKESYIHRIEEDEEGNVWIVTFDNVHQKYEVGYLKPDKLIQYEWISAPFNEIEEGTIHAIFHDQKGISWLGGQEGLYRFDPKELKKTHAPYYTQIRKVVSNGDSVLFWGAFADAKGQPTLTQPEDKKLKIDYPYNSITFHFAAQDYEDNESKFYSYYLEGFSEDWSEWSRETKAVFTNLHEGTYSFKVKTKNRYDIYSFSEPYTLTILPPWYRTWPAYIAYLISLTLIVLSVVRFWTRNLRYQVAEKTKEITHQKEIIEEKNNDIMSSIDYAQKIQQSILPSQTLLKEAFQESFILYRPRDVVSGDFYWIGERELRYYLAVMDCTGHGVPGAFMSMIGSNQLNELILEKGLRDPADVLNAMRTNIVKSLNQNEKSQTRDGMDGVLLSYHPRTKVLHYSGANNSIYVLRKSEQQLTDAVTMKSIKPIMTQKDVRLFELAPNKMPIGYYPEKADRFTSRSFVLNKGDVLYMTTDGFPDQFGGAKGKKFKKVNLLKLILSFYNEPLHKQKSILEKALADWMGTEHQQIDDICVVAIKV